MEKHPNRRNDRGESPPMCSSHNRKQFCKEGRTAHPQQHPATGSSSLLFSEDWLAVETLLCVQVSFLLILFLQNQNGCHCFVGGLQQHSQAGPDLDPVCNGFQFAIHVFIFSPDEEGCVYSLEHSGTHPSVLVMAQASWPAASSFQCFTSITWPN